MSIATRVKDYLEQKKVPYSHCTHRLAYTAQEVAAAQHVPGRKWPRRLSSKLIHGCHAGSACCDEST
jgi:hypothetical protein